MRLSIQPASKASLFLRYPSIALAANSKPKAARAPSMRFDGEIRGGGADLRGRDTIQQGAFERLPDYAPKMMVEKARTLFDLRVVPPRFSRADARTVPAPTIIVKGQTSNKTLQAIAIALSRCMPNSKLTITIPRAGHFSPVERPEEFNGIALRFLESNKK